jgi:hypothetical protein
MNVPISRFRPGVYHHGMMGLIEDPGFPTPFANTACDFARFI